MANTDYIPTVSKSAPSRNPRRLSGRLALLRDMGSMLGLFIVVLVLLIALLAPLLAPHDPTQQYLDDVFQRPSGEYILGTDHLGRDILSRLLYGAQTTLGATALVLMVMLLIAFCVGTIAGYVGSWVDSMLMRLVDLLLAFPGLILAIAVAGTLGTGLLVVTLAMASVWWAGYARLIRAMVLSIKQADYIEAAKGLGVPPQRIIFRHMLPNIMGPLAVLVSLDVGMIVLSIAGLNFLGLGVQPPTPEWGEMLHDAQPFLQTDPYMIVAPASMIFITVLGFNLLGDGLRDWLDPQNHRQR